MLFNLKNFSQRKIEQQSLQINELNEKNATLSSQLESQAELDRQK